ncbi:hypothetical protein GCM10011297_05210 [Bacterioplanes sanyensis]|uniref:hypothetical protein n=1 Tax=Bacterioplanes sanyensis TaxID=1249553 RepID=UPI00167966D0|nr:hypothetical protein [Bacterioplanes sanyensis]GGY35116.1 hypothetical protein GCM10011297_05210 [Bacterioplanes sanyensis]
MTLTGLFLSLAGQALLGFLLWFSAIIIGTSINTDSPTTIEMLNTAIYALPISAAIAALVVICGYLVGGARAIYFANALPLLAALIYALWLAVAQA